MCMSCMLCRPVNTLFLTSQDGNGLWYTDKWSEQQWLQSWSIVARRYANTTAVVGVGLRNEPRPTLLGGKCVMDTDTRQH